MSFISIFRAPVSLAALHHVRNAGIDDHQIPDNSAIVPKRKIVDRKPRLDVADSFSNQHEDERERHGRPHHSWVLYQEPAFLSSCKLFCKLLRSVLLAHKLLRSPLLV
jgi:hypothetical protein